jgi:cell wall-associated NlpC family hydrolase
LSHKHRRPSKITRISRQPLHLGVAAGVAGTVAVTGTLVASAAPATMAASETKKLAPVSRAASMTEMTKERANQRAIEQRNAQLRAAAEAKRIAAAKAKKKKEKAAARRAAAKRAAERRAAEARQQEAASRSVRTSGTDERMSRSAANVLSIAAAQQGDRYQYGANGPDSFDCSGFTQYVFGRVGISLPHSSSAQAGVARRVSSPQPGDLVFVYNGGGGSIGHVAIYAGNGYWYEASNPSRPVGKNRAWSSNVSYGRVL